MLKMREKEQNCRKSESQKVRKSESQKVRKSETAERGIGSDK